MTIGGYCRLNYHRLLIDISSYFIGGYSKLNYHRILMDIGGYFIRRYWWLLVVISGY